MAVWKEIGRGAYMSEAGDPAAGAEKAINTRSGTTGAQENFNRLTVKNRDVVEIAVNLNQGKSGGDVIWVDAKETLSIEPEAGIVFTTLSYTNNDGAVAVTADKINFRWAKCVRVG